MRRDATALSCTRTSRYVSFAFDCVARYVSAIYIRYLCTCVCLRVCKFMEATQFAKCIYAMLHISTHIYIYICVLNLYARVLLHAFVAAYSQASPRVLIYGSTTLTDFQWARMGGKYRYKFIFIPYIQIYTDIYAHICLCTLATFVLHLQYIRRYTGK